VFEMRFVSGRRQLAGVGGTFALPSNDLGRFRVYGLQPGRYILAADMGAALGLDDPTGYATTYFPGPPNPGEAQFIRIGVSEEASNLEFPLVPARTARVAGTTLNANGEPFQGAIQMRETRRSSAVATDSFGARTWPDGRFEFPAVPPGEYMIDAQSNNLHAMQLVNVNGVDIAGLVLQARLGSSMSGRVVFDGGDPPTSRAVGLALQSADEDLTPFTSGMSSNMNADGTFEFTNVVGPHRLRVMSSPSGWTLKQVLVSGIDATDAVMPFGTRDQSLKNVDVVFTNQITSARGTVVD